MREGRYDMLYLAFGWFTGRSGKTAVPAENAGESVSGQANEDVLAVYSALAAKRVNYDLMLWQAPMISSTAQAFLLSVALDEGKGCDFDRIWAGVAAFAVGLASIQLFRRHSRMERKASDMLEALEKKYSLECAHGPLVPGQSSKQIWLFCLGFISAISLIPIFVGIWKLQAMSVH